MQNIFQLISFDDLKEIYNKNEKSKYGAHMNYYYLIDLIKTKINNENDNVYSSDKNYWINKCSLARNTHQYLSNKGLKPADTFFDFSSENLNPSDLKIIKKFQASYFSSFDVINNLDLNQFIDKEDFNVVDFFNNFLCHLIIDSKLNFTHENFYKIFSLALKEEKNENFSKNFLNYILFDKYAQENYIHLFKIYDKALNEPNLTLNERVEYDKIFSMISSLIFNSYSSYYNKGFSFLHNEFFQLDYVNRFFDKEKSFSLFSHSSYSTDSNFKKQLEEIKSIISSYDYDKQLDFFNKHPSLLSAFKFWDNNKLILELSEKYIENEKKFEHLKIKLLNDESNVGTKNVLSFFFKRVFTFLDNESLKTLSKDTFSLALQYQAVPYNVKIKKNISNLKLFKKYGIENFSPFFSEWRNKFNLNEFINFYDINETNCNRKIFHITSDLNHSILKQKELSIKNTLKDDIHNFILSSDTDISIIKNLMATDKGFSTFLLDNLDIKVFDETFKLVPNDDNIFLYSTNHQLFNKCQDLFKFIIEENLFLLGSKTYQSIEYYSRYTPSYQEIFSRFHLLSPFIDRSIELLNIEDSDKNEKKYLCYSKPKFKVANNYSCDTKIKDTYSLQKSLINKDYKSIIVLLENDKIHRDRIRESDLDSKILNKDIVKQKLKI